MRAITVSDSEAGVGGLSLTEQPYPRAAENDVIVQVHAAGFTRGELEWPGTWTDRAGRDRTPSVPGHELAGVVVELGYGTTGLTVGQRVFGLVDWSRNGSLAEYTAIEARNLAPLPADVDYVTAAALPISGLTAWQALFDHAHLATGQTVLIHGAGGAVGSVAVQLAREVGAHIIGTGRAKDQKLAGELGVHEFLDLDSERLEDAGQVDVVFDVIGGEILARSTAPAASRRHPRHRRRTTHHPARRRPGRLLRRRSRPRPTHPAGHSRPHRPAHSSRQQRPLPRRSPRRLHRQRPNDHQGRRLESRC